MGERMTVQECAERLGMCIPTFRKLCNEGKFDFVIVSNAKNRKTYWIIKSKFERYMDESIR